MHVIEHTYVSLLADAARITGFSEIRGSYEGLHWCLNEAPKLEKKMLLHLETGESLSLEEWPHWLRRLALASKDANYLRVLRQLLLFCYKANVTHDNKKTQEALAGFIDTNAATGNFGQSLARESPRLLDSARRHVQSVLYKLRPEKIIPGHGPGAVTTSKEKWLHRYSTIESLYPQSDWFCLSQNRPHQELLDDCSYEDIIKAKLIAVPKDSRGPRLICVHPAEAIWIQQGLRCELERSIGSMRSSYGPWPRGRIRFDDQTVNGRIALTSSRTRRYATLDMKEASDRISDILVQILFGRKYKWFGCCRAQVFEFKDPVLKTGFFGQLHSYAPMGNATTFPVQSLVFWAICVAAMQRLGFHQPGAVFVFGDDIEVPVECVPAVIDGLESFGLLVNRSKSFWRGGFRESCGVDAFNGKDVTPVRWKTTLDAEHIEGLQSLSDIGQRLRVAGYEEAALATYSALRTKLRRLKLGLFSTNNPDHGGVAEFVTNDYSVWRDAYWHRDLQWFVSPVHRLKQYEPYGSTSGWNHVLESVCSLERTAGGQVPSRALSRGAWLDRGWTHVR